MVVEGADPGEDAGARRSACRPALRRRELRLHKPGVGERPLSAGALPWRGTGASVKVHADAPPGLTLSATAGRCTAWSPSLGRAAVLRDHPAHVLRQRRPPAWPARGCCSFLLVAVRSRCRAFLDVRLAQQGGGGAGRHGGWGAIRLRFEGPRGVRGRVADAIALRPGPRPQRVTTTLHVHWAERQEALDALLANQFRRSHSTTIGPVHLHHRARCRRQRRDRTGRCREGARRAWQCV